MIRVRQFSDYFETGVPRVMDPTAHLCGSVGLVIIAALLTFGFWRFNVDDSYIGYRIAENVAAGGIDARRGAGRAAEQERRLVAGKAQAGDGNRPHSRLAVRRDRRVFDRIRSAYEQPSDRYHECPVLSTVV